MQWSRNRSLSGRLVVLSALAGLWVGCGGDGGPADDADAANEADAPGDAGVSAGDTAPATDGIGPVGADDAGGATTDAHPEMDAVGPIGPVPKTCAGLFALDAKHAKNAAAVALTGSFLTPAWPKTVAKGAVALTFDKPTQQWRGNVTLRHGHAFRYRFVVKLPGEVTPVTMNQAGKVGSATTGAQWDCGPAVGAAPLAGDARIKALLRWWLEHQVKHLKFVGLAAFVRKGGKQLALDAEGIADKTTNSPVDPDKTLFRWASMSKMVGGILAARLALAGKLDLDAPIGAYLQGYAPPKTWVQKCKAGAKKTWGGAQYACKSGFFTMPLSTKQRRITLRRLLAHLAGIPHYTNGVGNPSPPASKTNDKKLNTGPKWALQWLYPKPLVAVPGSAAKYSTFGANLAGVALADAVTSTFEQLAKTEVFGPAGMTTARPDKEWLKLPNRAAGYWKAPDGAIYPQGSSDVSWKLPGGGFVSTAADLDRFCAALTDDTLLDAPGRKLAWTRARTTAGKSVGYGLAFGVSSRNGRAYVGHGGSQQKAKTHLRLFTKDKLCLGIMCNSSWASTSKLIANLEDAVRTAWALDK